VKYGEWIKRMFEARNLISLNSEVYIKLTSDYARTLWPFIDSQNNHTFLDAETWLSWWDGTTGRIPPGSASSSVRTFGRHSRTWWRPGGWRHGISNRLGRVGRSHTGITTFIPCPGKGCLSWTYREMSCPDRKIGVAFPASSQDRAGTQITPLAAARLAGSDGTADAVGHEDGSALLLM
jgi:hypothetical protein